MSITIMQGLPGSGKSTLAKTLGVERIVSADDYFMVDGVYRFDPKGLTQAHGQCFRRAIEALQMGADVVVDNTNTTAVEIAPYVALGRAYGAAVRIMRAEAPLALCFARQSHSVPLSTLTRMAEAMLVPLPPFFPGVTLISTVP